MSFLNFIKTERGKKVGIATIFAGISAMFCFMAYEFMRSSSESVFLSFFPASQKVYALTLTPVFLFLIIYFYGFLLSKFGSKKTMLIYFAFVFISIISLYVLTLKKIAWAGFGLLIFKEGYIVVLSEIYWSYINSILKQDEARILNGPMAGLGALGSLIGGYFVSSFAVRLTTKSLILYSSFLLIPSLLFLYYAYNISGEPEPTADEKGGKKGHLHLSIFVENKTVMLLAVVVFIAQIVSTLGDINFTYYVQQYISDLDLRTAYLGGFWQKVNIISFTMQFLITPVVLRKFKVKYVLVLIPLLYIMTSLYSFIHPSLFSASLVLMIFKSMDYSIYRASKEIIYIPFSYDTRYRAKQFVDAFTYRFSKGFTSLILSLMNILSYNFIPLTIPLIAAFSGLWSYLAGRFKIEE